MTPVRVIVARFRKSAVIGMSSSSASQTSGEVRCSGWSASRGSPNSRTSRRRLRCRRRRLCACEALDDLREARGVASADDPLEQASVIGR